MPLSTDQEVSSAAPTEELTLARGCTAVQAQTLQVHNSDHAATPPTEHEAVMHVAEYANISLVEFTADAVVARAFGGGTASGVVVTVRIQKRYLTRGSTSESGWVCRVTAPWEYLNQVPAHNFNG